MFPVPINPYDFYQNKKDDFINSNLEEIWTICILGIMKDRCSVLDKNLNSKIIHEKYFSDINIRQIKKIN